MIRFQKTSLEHKGNLGGMVSRIREHLPNKFISIEHIGILSGTREILSGPEIESWAGALENYKFSTVRGMTLVEVCLDTNPEFKAYFTESWPKALDAFHSSLLKLP